MNKDVNRERIILLLCCSITSKLYAFGLNAIEFLAVPILDLSFIYKYAFRLRFNCMCQTESCVRYACARTHTVNTNCAQENQKKEDTVCIAHLHDSTHTYTLTV